MHLLLQQFFYCPAELATVTYTITAENKGPVDLTSITINDTLPAGVTLSGTPTVTKGSFTSGVWTIPSMLSGDLETLTIVVTVDSGTTGDLIMNTASYGTSIPVDPHTVPSTATIVPVP